MIPPEKVVEFFRGVIPAVPFLGLAERRAEAECTPGAATAGVIQSAFGLLDEAGLAGQLTHSPAA
jgi:hypothetical protein